MVSERIQRQIDRLLDQAEEAVTNGAWSTVDSRAQSVLAIDPANSDATSYLAAADRALNGSTPAAKGDSTTSDQLAKIFSRANDAIFVLDPPRGKILDVNPKACDMLGYSREELLSIGIFAVHPGEMPMFLSFTDSVYGDQYGWTDEITCYTKTGEEVPTEISASTVELDNRPCIVAIVRDITERKHADEALRQSEERYRDLYQLTPVMMHSIDREGRLVSVNDYWLEALGYQPREVYGRRSTEFLTEASRRYAVEVALPEFMRTGLARDVEYQMVKKNGEVMDVLLSGISKKDQSGEMEYSQAFIVDVTEQKRTEETRRQLAILEERNRIAREIHDTLAQSLMGILMQVEAAGELMGDASEAARTKIELAGNLARESVEEARRSVWELAPLILDSNDLLEAIQQEITQAGERGIQTSLEIRGEQPDQLDRRNKLAVLRIVQEALSNIIRHAQTKSALVRLSYGPSELRLSVSDDGIGFDTTASHPALSSMGTGFGLISIQERARLAGGYIEIHSTPHVGTQVEATIPYQPNSGSPSALEETSAAADSSQDGGPGIIRVLIADDHEVFRRGILHTIEQIKGMMVVGEAKDGEDAIEKIQALAPDVVLLDIRMPKLDGVETLLRLPELELQTRVILLSAYATDEYIFDGLRAGAGGYLLKNVKRDDLANAIRTVHEGGSLLHPVIAKRLIEQLDNKETSGLSDREIEVIRRLASGGRNKEIAAQLSVTIHTVKFHLENIYRKLGVQTRVEAVRVASERGILTG